MRLPIGLCAAIALGVVLVTSCSSIPQKRVDTILHNALAEDLGADLADVTIEAGPSYMDSERVVRELFPLAAAGVGISPALRESDSEYAIWLREEGYSRDIDAYSAVLCVLKLRSKEDGAILATTVVSDETTLNLKSSGYIYSLLRDALCSMRGSIAASEKAGKAAPK